MVVELSQATLTGEADDPDGIVDIKWTSSEELDPQGDPIILGTDLTVPDVELHVYAPGGYGPWDHLITLEVTDGAGKTNTDSFLITVLGPES